MNKYYPFKNMWYCSEHRTTFPLDSTCPSCGKSESVKCDASEKVHEESRRITKKSRRVIVQRFHSYRVKFEADVDWDALFSEAEFSLNNGVKYKRLDYPLAIVKVFRRSIFVILRSCAEVKGLSVVDAKARSDLIVRDVVSLLPKSIRVRDSRVSSVHNAFVNHPAAVERINLKVDGQTRIISDHSKGRLELEAVSPVFAVSDSVALEDDILSLVDRGLSRDFLAQSIQKLVEDREYYADNLRSHVVAIQQLSRGIDLFNAQLGGRFSRNPVVSPLFSSLSEKSAGGVSSVHHPRSVNSLPAQSNLLRWFK